MRQDISTDRSGLTDAWTSMGPTATLAVDHATHAGMRRGLRTTGTSLSSQMRWLKSCSKNFLIVSVIRRQKTVEKKTECRCGRGTGFWCGSCLSTRMGQNIQEVFRMPDWSCPSCLQICNCSGRTCDRHLAGLGCTRILSGEARDQGYMSVSFPTILSSAAQIQPMLDAFQ